MNISPDYTKSSSILAAEKITTVGISPKVTDKGLVEYRVFIEYTPDSRYAKASLEGKITLVGVIDSSEYVFKDGAGSWSASYEERWKGEYIVSTEDDATAEYRKTSFTDVYHNNPMSVIHQLMLLDVASFFNDPAIDLAVIRPDQS